MKLNVNGRAHDVDADPAMPLLSALADDLGLRGPRLGCGLAQCGSCSVLVDGREMRACVTPLSAIGHREVTTLEGLPGLHARSGRAPTVSGLHPVQEAFIAEQAPQCGYCFNGIAIKAAELLAADPSPTEARVRAALDGHLCRCGTYPRILAAVMRASTAMAGGAR